MPSRDGGAAGSIGKWLTVVGIGEDGVAGLGENAQAAISSAAHVFGGRRHLALAAPLIRGGASAWPTPFDASMREVVARRGEQVCVLASGDPMLFGIGATLARFVPREETAVLPAPSAFSLAASRLGWSLGEVETVSLHGKPVELIRPLLHPGRHIVALTSDGEAPSLIAALLVADGFGPSAFHVLEALGGSAGAVVTLTAAELGDRVFAALNVVAIDVAATPEARVVPLGTGLPDSAFEHDGQITKREIRAMTLSALSPRRGELLWDIGAGSGSVGIEWMLAHPSMRAIAVEAAPQRAERIRRNALALGVPGLEIAQGEAPAALAGLRGPDAIFIGGGGSDAGVTEAAIAALKPGGRLVANAVTLEMEAVLLRLHARQGGDLTRVAISRAAPVGQMSGWRPAMPVTQWTWVNR